MIHLNEKEVLQKIQSRIGSSVKFKYPNGSRRRGILVDRVVEVGSASINSEGNDYYNVIDWIKFPDDDEHNIRLGYYIYSNEKGLRWGSQTTLCEPESLIAALFKKGAKKQWFHTVLPKKM